MAGDARNLSIRVRQELVDRLQALVPYIAADPRLQALLGRCSRSDVARVALLKGVEQLEAEYGAREEDS